jgi:tRNA (mo5U34)-methyltransferase
VSSASREPSALEAAVGEAGWYHTIDLGDGLVTDGYWDHRTVVDRYGLPDSLEGKTALDVGTADGFFAFELERRGADRVVAIDVATHADFDWLPGRMPAGAQDLIMKTRFEIAHKRLGSAVEHRTCSVYDLSPETVGEFDVVMCGSLLLHLMNPLKALCNIRSVTRELAVIESLSEPALASYVNEPFMRFGHSDLEPYPGEAGIYWRFGARALQEMLVYAGFAASDVMPPFVLPPREMDTLAVRGFPTEADAPDSATVGIPAPQPAPPPEPVPDGRRMAGLRDALGPTLHHAPIVGPVLASRRARRTPG